MVFGRVEECDISRLVYLVKRVLERCFIALLIVRTHSRCTVVQIRGQDCLGPVNHEEGHEARRVTLGRVKAP